MLQDNGESNSVVHLTVTSTNNVSERDRLISRVEQQSELIALMKKRSDGLIGELEILYKNLAKETASKEEIGQQLVRKERQLDDKDKQLYALSATCDKLSATNKNSLHEIESLRLHTDALLRDKVTTIEETKSLRETLKCLTTQLGMLTQQNKVLKKGMDVTTSDAKTELTELTTKYRGALSHVSALERQVEGLESKLSNVTQLAKEEKDSHVLICTDLLERLQGAALEGNRWKEKATDLEKTVIDGKQTQLDDQLRVPMPHNETLQDELIVIRRNLALVEKEFSIYKQHSIDLLHHERELNSKLRHLAL